MKKNEWWKDLWPELVTSLVVLIIFLICVDVYQYLTTEHWWILDEIDHKKTTLFFLFLIVFFSIVPVKSLFSRWPKLGYLVLVLFLTVLFAHRKYTRFYNELQQYPKIKSISKNWGIPGSWVKINGTNFGEESNPGSIFLGEKEMIIKKWNDKEVIFEINMEAGSGVHDLKLFNNRIKQQIKNIEFEIKSEND